MILFDSDLGPFLIYGQLKGKQMWITTFYLQTIVQTTGSFTTQTLPNDGYQLYAHVLDLD